MDVESLVPKDKFDIVNIERIQNLKPEDISTISFRLLEWLADINWPVAQALVKVLPKFHKELLPDIRHILSDEINDSEWKWQILEYLVNQFPKESITLLKDSLLRISMIQAEKDSDEEYLKKTAAEILENLT
ncbi:DUF5071 domain-containing protein [Dysgonomonas sp. OttesenSCG-928-M03]|nr:DUF5071 domain-containing protein [Dysgonomonas sp. OttesenSCG-928-M03]